MAENSPKRFSEDNTYKSLSRVATSLGLTIDRSQLDLGDLASGGDDQNDLTMLVEGSKHLGISLTEIIKPGDALVPPDEIIGLVREGFPVVFAHSDGSFRVIESVRGSRVSTSVIDETITFETIRPRRLKSLQSDEGIQVFAAKPELECEMVSSLSTKHHPAEADHDHIGPFRRFVLLMKLDARDIWLIVIFAVVEGVLSLATPLAVESLVNVVSWGTYLQPLLVIAVILLSCLAIAAILKVLQVVVVEMIQRRQFVRIVGDLSHRLPRVKREALIEEYPRELANRIFDIMTIQKSSASLLLDGISIILTTTLGMVLLAFYHPFLLGFDIVLLASMISITWMLGRGGVITAINESKIKYKVAHWLQDVISTPTAFKINGGESMSVDRANRLVGKYLEARRFQFRVVLRQSIFAIGLQVVASTAVLGIGGWLVIHQQLTLGQLVASELVVTVIVGAFAKAGKSFEKYYDLMAGIDKVGHLLDLPVDLRTELGDVAEGPAPVRWTGIKFGGVFPRSAQDADILAGEKIALHGGDCPSRSMLAEVLVGMRVPAGGFAEVGGIDAAEAALESRGAYIAYADNTEPFHASIHENIELGRSGIGKNRVREALQKVGLWNDVNRLPAGLNTPLQTGGYPLAESQVAKINLAAAIASRPRFLVVNGLLDIFDQSDLDTIYETLLAKDAPWTLVLSTSKDAIAARCDRQINVSGG